MIHRKGLGVNYWHVLDICVVLNVLCFTYNVAKSMLSTVGMCQRSVQ